ncbi:hypothetical protein D3C80_2059390 [compost metagenome]
MLPQKAGLPELDEGFQHGGWARQCQIGYEAAAGSDFRQRQQRYKQDQGHVAHRLRCETATSERNRANILTGLLHFCDLNH